MDNMEFTAYTDTWTSFTCRGATWLYVLRGGGLWVLLARQKGVVTNKSCAHERRRKICPTYSPTLGKICPSIIFKLWVVSHPPPSPPSSCAPVCMLSHQIRTHKNYNSQNHWGKRNLQQAYSRLVARCDSYVTCCKAVLLTQTANYLATNWLTINLFSRCELFTCVW
jgi:hypothetical protein